MTPARAAVKGTKFSRDLFLFFLHGCFNFKFHIFISIIVI